MPARAGIASPGTGLARPAVAELTGPGEQLTPPIGSTPPAAILSTRARQPERMSGQIEVLWHLGAVT